MAVEFVLDSSAALAVLQREPGWESVAKMLPSSAISAVNASEVVTVLMRRGAGPAEAVNMLAMLELTIHPWDEELMVAGAAVAPFAWTHGLSCGDRACLTLAQRLRVPVVTADRAWKALPDSIARIRFVR